MNQMLPSSTYINSVHALKKREKLFGMLVTRLDSSGKGLIRIKSRTDNRVFSFAVDQIIPGERVTLSVDDVRVTTPPGRRKPIRVPQFSFLSSSTPSDLEISSCPKFKQGCRGCTFPQLDYKAQLVEKAKFIADILLVGKNKQTTENVFDLPESIEIPVSGISHDKFVNNHLDFARLKITGPGTFSTNFDTPFPIKKCPALHPHLTFTLEKVQIFLKKFQVFEDRRGTGFIKEVLLRRVEDSVLVGIVVAPIENEIDKLQMTCKQLISEKIAGVSIAVSSLDDCAEDLIFECVAGSEALDLRINDGMHLSVSIDSNVFACSENIRKITNELMDNIFESKNAVLFVNCKSKSFLRQIARPSDRFVNHAKDWSGREYVNQIVVDLFDCDSIKRNFQEHFETVVVCGELSKQMREYIEENQKIRKVIYATNDVHKIAWDSQKFSKFNMKHIKAYDESPHNMKVYIIAVLLRK